MLKVVKTTIVARDVRRGWGIEVVPHALRCGWPTLISVAVPLIDGVVDIVVVATTIATIVAFHLVQCLAITVRTV